MFKSTLVRTSLENIGNFLKKRFFFIMDKKDNFTKKTFLFNRAGRMMLG